MKARLIGTSVGRLALTARNAIELLRAAYPCPESIGTLANDQLATHLVTRLCLPGKGFIDVGAHIGSIISAVIDSVPSTTIYAIEPTRAKIEYLRRKFPSVELHECAVGDSEGEVEFFVNAKQSGCSSLKKPPNAEGTVVIKVPLRRLDALISANDIDVIKIDVEGAELGVLQGGDGLISRNRPVVMFESGPGADGEPADTKRAIWQWLEQHNFETVVPNRVAHEGPGLSLDGFLEAHLYPRRTTNYFAIPKERRNEIRERARMALGIVAG